MIVYADKSLEPKLMDIFNICFPNEEDFCRWFFKNIFSAENTLVDIENNSIRAMAEEIDCYIEGLGEATYLYAVATLPQYRGKGICRRLIERSHREDIKKGKAASILIPGSSNLFGFYEKLGYKKSAFISEREVYAPSHDQNADNYFAENTVKTGEINAEDMIKIYERELSCGSYIKRDKAFFETQKDMFKKFGGGCKGLFEKDTPLAYCFYSFDDDNNIFFDEVMGCQKNILMEKILSELKAHKGKFRSTGGTKPLGMAYFYKTEKPFYMNLMYN